MDEKTKKDLHREIVEPLMAAIDLMRTHVDARHEETQALVERCISDQMSTRAEIAELTTRIEALEGARTAHEHRLAGHERKILDGVAEAKAVASDVRAELEGTIGGMHRTLADGLKSLEGSITDMRTNVDRAVLKALARHVKSLEEAADRLAKGPRVKAAAAIGGTFAGSATVAIIVEILKHL